MTEVVERDDVLERPDKIRMSLDLSPEMKSVIDDLAGRSGTTRSDVLRRAIALLKAVKDAEAAGESPALIDRERHVKARLVGI